MKQTRARKISKQSVTLTLERLGSANCAVISELEALGFYDEHLSKTEVYLVWVSGAYGYQYYGGDGSICIPRLSISALIDRYRGEATSLKDVLRHEYAHAVADTHRGLMRSLKFKEGFGAPHNWDFEWEYDPAHHVTEYAATATGEDFAEVFYLYVKHKGKLPKRLGTLAIRKKWEFVDQLAAAIRCGKRRW